MAELFLDTNKNLTVTVISSEIVIYEGTVKAVSSINEKGRFDVLPMHGNFISVVRDKLILHEKANQKREMKIKNGILKVSRDRVFIFLGIEGLS